MPLLVPVSFFYAIITRLRNQLFDLGIIPSVEFDFPVISVGNITAGGTGKTPHVEYLIHLLNQKKKIAILSRGYKRCSRGFVLASKGTTPSQIGDESFQIWQKFRNILVAVDEKRVRGIRLLMKQDPEINCIILDDAFQHRHVLPGVSIVLIDYFHPLSTDRMLPAGNLREQRDGIHRANIVIVTKVPHEIKPIEKRLWIKELNLFPYQFLYFSTFSYGELIPVFDKKQKKLSLDALSEMKPSVLLVTGIATPQPLKDMLITCCSSIEHLQFSDHYDYALKDIKEIEKCFSVLPGNSKLILTTEKDAVKIKTLGAVDRLLKTALYYIPVRVVFLDEKQKEFDANILDYVAKNRRISRLHC